MCGPPINFWGMRFEGKHRESTVTASVSNNKVNVAKTIVTKHELKFASQLYSKNIKPAFQTGPSSSCTFKDLQVIFQDSLVKIPNFHNKTLNKVSWVEKNGSLYKPDMILCIGENDSEPIFGLIKFIFIINDMPFFAVQQLTTHFLTHEYAYEVISISKICNKITYSELFNFKPLSLSSRSNKNYITLRCYL